MDKNFAIFDMDGTLVDSMGYWRNIEQEFLVKKGFTKDLDEILEATKPMTLKEFAAYFSQRTRIDLSPEQLIEEVQAVMEEHYRHDVTIKPGVIAYLESLKSRGIPMCVASATSKHLVELCLTRLGLREYFQFVLSCVDVGAGKSQPDVFLEAARRLGTSPANCAVYEDAIYAVRSAHSAGFHVVAVKDAHNDVCWDEMLGLADEVITDWNTALS